MITYRCIQVEDLEGGSLDKVTRVVRLGVSAAMFGRLASSSKYFSRMAEHSKEDLWQRQELR
jgi:hypothetical protein